MLSQSGQDAASMAPLLAASVCGLLNNILRNIQKIEGVWNIISNAQQSLMVINDKRTHTM